ncbi:TPA: isochorismatase family protein [Escherichia coli]|nr:isochorismatase family protein [Escherichia coli]HAM7797519.1 isochorismatase family protein [Escherichia coli]
MLFPNFSLGEEYEHAPPATNRQISPYLPSGRFRTGLPVEGLAIERGDLFYACPRASVFYGTALDADLRTRGVSTLVMAGISTTGVVLSALVASAMGIASLMTSTIMERAKEIGLMKALGARQWQIMLLFYLEAASSGLAGGALGCIAGWGLAKAIGVMLFDAPLNFAWIVVPCVLVIAVLIALIGTWFPARRIARLYPVEVLYGR